MNVRVASRSLALIAALVCSALPLSSVAQPWPSKPITMVIVFAPGGTTDIVGRQLAAKLSTQLGQQVIVDNRVGAGGTIGANAVARAKPDGYTMLMLTSTHTVGETLYKARPYDLVRDFTPISLIGTSPYWLLVNPEVTKAATMKDFVAMMQKAPGKYTYASGGSGGITHLAAEMMKLEAHLDVTHVPFKGNAPALTEIMAGRVDMIFDQPASSESYVKAGKLKPLAVTSKTRIPTAPEVPTMIESGFPGFEAEAFFGLAFPAGTPKDIVDKMNAEVVKALASPDLKQKLEAAGTTPVTDTPAEFGELIKAETLRWRKVIADAKVTTE